MLLTDSLYVLIRIWWRFIAREVHLKSHACSLMLGMLCFPAKDHHKPRDAHLILDTHHDECMYGTLYI